jgi:hypothetical protein
VIRSKDKLLRIKEGNVTTSPTTTQRHQWYPLKPSWSPSPLTPRRNVEGAYLHADMDEEVIMVFEGDMVDYMVQANPAKDAAYVHTTKSGKKLLFVELLKALYGCIKSALLWYNLFTSTLKDVAFVTKPI